MSTISAGTTLTSALVQTGDTSGNLVLQTNGTTTAVSIDTSQAVTASVKFISASGLIENSKTVSANYTVSSGSNAMSAGPVTVASGITVTVPTGSRWVVV